MSKFNTADVRPAAHSPVTSENIPSGVTHQGAPGYVRDTRSELFLLAVTNMVGEDTFYESGGARDDRFTQLVHQATELDPEWTAKLLVWLRTEANLRSAALVGAAEFAAKALELTIPGGRQVVASVLRRADEPGEMLAYWRSRHGRTVPMPVKRGVADGLVRLYTERSLLKYDSDAHGFRFGDVIELTHPTASAPWQNDLFRHALDRRHKRDNPIPESLAMLRARAELMALAPGDRRPVLDRDDAGEVLAAAGMTWESLAGWLQGPMDARAWSVVLPSMGYMARLRNLRNLDRAEVPDDVAGRVGDYLCDPGEVARSRQLPMRFLSAYRAAPSLRWSYPLEKALDLSLSGIPALAGRTLILVDTSGSMQAGFSQDGTVARWDAAVMFGLALAARCARPDVVSFSSEYTYPGVAPSPRSRVFPRRRAESLLSGVRRWGEEGFFLGAGTDTAGALAEHFAGHDRVVILTDEQAGRGDVGQVLPATVPLYTWNLAGYRHGHGPSGSGNRHTFGGLNDSGFRMISLLEAGVDGRWPWENAPVA
ncbi:vWA domain-containing protein [Pseudonocardia spinosispora]|uniref:vWA domain-containing protein n=1 Tax=Pseudonocardia spinosispora TaxID=103441 RepID=UPI000410AAD6|nr:TROVE domain-containing protein [Pseudonocardia spinosispora]